MQTGEEIAKRFQSLRRSDAVTSTHATSTHGKLSRFKGSFTRIIIKLTYNFLACDRFKKLLFPTNSLAKLLSDSLLSDSLLSDSSTNQINSKL